MFCIHYISWPNKKQASNIISTVDENIIGAHKMRNHFWYTVNLYIFSIFSFFFSVLNFDLLSV